MKQVKKKDFPTDQIRRFLEPGPIVLVSSAWKGQQNIMTMGWHMVMGFDPTLIGCYNWDENHGLEMIRKSKECVFNIPTTALAETVVKIGNCSGEGTDKFSEFMLTAGIAKKVSLLLSSRSVTQTSNANSSIRDLSRNTVSSFSKS